MTKEDDPKSIDTFAKIIGCIKRDLHDYIDNPNNQTASALYLSMGSIPFKYKEYEFWNDSISEIREYMSMLFQLFEGYFQAFIKKGLEYDKIVENSQNHGN